MNADQVAERAERRRRKVVALCVELCALTDGLADPLCYPVEKTDLPTPEGDQETRARCLEIVDRILELTSYDVFERSLDMTWWHPWDREYEVMAGQVVAETPAGHAFIGSPGILSLERSDGAGASS